jgi:hypothetical protein
VATISGAITAHTLRAKVATAVNLGTSTVTASLRDTRIGVLGVPVIQVGVVQSSSQVTCSGSAGQVTISSITITISVGGVRGKRRRALGPTQRSTSTG